MIDLDERMQDLLDKLEAGSSLAEIRLSLTADEAELIPILNLAATLRDVPRPELPAAVVRRQREEVLASAGRTTNQGARPLFVRRPWVVPGMAAAMVVMVVVLAVVIGGLLQLGGIEGRVVTVVHWAGLVEYAPAGKPGQWAPILTKGTLEAGDRIRTGESGEVVVEFPDGSSTAIGPDAVLVLETIQTGRTGRQYVVSLERGETIHAVKADLRPEAKFIVQTPGGFADVQGTWFEVWVDPQGTARFAVAEGAILVEGAARQVNLTAGQVSTLVSGEAPSPPANQFSGQGQITLISGTTWWIGGLPVTVINQTHLAGNPTIGDFVAVIGRLVDGDLWIADRLEVVSGQTNLFQFAGPVEVIEESTWRIAGVVVNVDGNTLIDESLESGSIARVNFLVQSDGSYLALVINAIEGPPVINEPHLAFEPDFQLGQGCQVNYQFEASLENITELPVDGVDLIGAAVQGESYLLSLEINPGQINSIPAGTGVTIEVGVMLNLDWLVAPEGEVVEIRVIAYDETSGSGEDFAHLRLHIPNQCITPTSTPTPTPTPTPEPSPPPGDGKVTVCHIPPGNPGNAHTISIDSSAVPAHLAHGDILGPCP